MRLLLGKVPHESGIGDDGIAELRGALADFLVDSVPGTGQFIGEENPAVVVVATLHLPVNSPAL